MFAFLDKLLGKTGQRPARALALYGPHNDTLDLLAGLDWVLKWAKKLGLPEAEWVNWNYGGPSNRQYKQYKLNAWLKRGRVLPSDTCTSFGTGRFLPDSEGDITDDIWYASMSVEDHHLTFVADLNATALTDDVLCEMALNVQALSNFDYGYVFQMPMEMSPPTYERGLLFGPSFKRGLSQTQEDEISKWGSARRGCGDYLDDEISHYLRDIYPLNFLNPHHLAMQVKGQSLKDWIEADARRGTLKPLIEGKLWTWAVPENRIQAIRKVLGPQRLLISWGDFNTPSGGPLGHTYGARKGEVPVFNGQPLSADEQRWIADGLGLMKPIFERYTGESPQHFEQLIASRTPLFAKLLDLAFTAWSEDARPDRPAPEQALQAFAAALGEHLVRHHRMGWYVVEDEHGRSLGVCHRGKGGAQTWSYPVDAVAKRIDRGETGFIAAVVAAVAEQIKRG